MVKVENIRRKYICEFLSKYTQNEKVKMKYRAICIN